MNVETARGSETWRYEIRTAVKSYRYADLTEIAFSLSMVEVFDLLKKAGEIPDGFGLDNLYDTGCWPAELRVKREIVRPASSEPESR